MFLCFGHNAGARAMSLAGSVGEKVALPPRRARRKRQLAPQLEREPAMFVVIACAGRGFGDLGATVTSPRAGAPLTRRQALSSELSALLRGSWWAAVPLHKIPCTRQHHGFIEYPVQATAALDAPIEPRGQTARGIAQIEDR